MMKNNFQIKHHSGFTLIEILIALFIFSVLSLLLANGLHTIMGLNSRTEESAERLRGLQFALLIFERDVEQAINREIYNSSDREEPAFKGNSKEFFFTHLGKANPTGMIGINPMQRTHYYVSEKIFYRATWPVLDQTPQTRPNARALLTNINECQFQYLDQSGRFHNDWPQLGNKNPLPVAVKVALNISNWGKISQLYVISAKPTNE